MDIRTTHLILKRTRLRTSTRLTITMATSQVSKGNMMEVEGKGSQARSSKGKGKRQGKSKGKGKERCPGPCLLCHGPHWARDPSHHGGKGSVNPLAKDTRTLHRFDRLTWKATNISAQVQVLLQSRFHPCRILSVLTSTESSFSILDPQCPLLISCREFKKCTRQPGHSHPVSPLILRERTKRTCRQVFCLYRICPGKSYFTFEC